MKLLSHIVNIVLFTITSLFIITVICTLTIKKPFMMIAVKSNSMCPVFKRGDIKSCFFS
ncbi:MAG: hypothetical protein PWP27_1073 [Clostridiales bacterium]|jgi:signal peptidase I|nr:hypothetical protein [Clostridiales bacterium]MDK2933263.1 hypothetical protein [Clostridiales bacterium]